MHKKKIDTIHTTNESGNKSEAMEILKKTGYLNPNYLFIDGGRFNKSFINFLKRNKIKIIKIDDNYKADKIKTWAIVNPNIYAKKNSYRRTSCKKIFAGKKYVLLRPEFQAKPRKEKKTKILISLGVSAGQKLVMMLIRNLKNLGFKVEIAKKYNAAQMVKAIDTSSAVICGASVTLHEVWTRKKIAIPIYQAKDQVQFYKWLKKRSFPVFTFKKNQESSLAYAITKKIDAILKNKLKTFPKIGPRGADMVIKKLFFAND